MKIKICFAFFALALSLGSCSKKKECVIGTVDPNKICTMEYAPVCGCDGKTYASACVAEGSGISSYEQGECKKKKN